MKKQKTPRRYTREEGHKDGQAGHPPASRSFTYGEGYAQGVKERGLTPRFLAVSQEQPTRRGLDPFGERRLAAPTPVAADAADSVEPRLLHTLRVPLRGCRAALWLPEELTQDDLQRIGQALAPRVQVAAETSMPSLTRSPLAIEAAAPAARRGVGRPQDPRPKKTTTVRLDQELIDWVNRNVSREISLSTFVNEALRQKIARTKGRKRRAGSH